MVNAVSTTTPVPAGPAAGEATREAAADESGLPGSGYRSNQQRRFDGPGSQAAGSYRDFTQTLKEAGQGDPQAIAMLAKHK